MGPGARACIFCMAHGGAGSASRRIAAKAPTQCYRPFEVTPGKRVALAAPLLRPARAIGPRPPSRPAPAPSRPLRASRLASSARLALAPLVPLSRLLLTSAPRTVPSVSAILFSLRNINTPILVGANIYSHFSLNTTHTTHHNKPQPADSAEISPVYTISSLYVAPLSVN